MQSSTQTVDEYLQSLPADRRTSLQTLRQLILDNLPEGYTEGMLWGMITYYIPLERYPDTYNQQPLSYIALASQKNYMALYMMGVYSNKDAEEKLRKAFEAAGKTLDMGKSCIRFKKLEDLELNVIAELIAGTPISAFIDSYEKARKK